MSAKPRLVVNNDKPKTPRVPKPKIVLTAKEWEQRIDALLKMEAKERREYLKAATYQVQVRELKFETLAAIRASRLPDEEIQARGGAAPSTLEKWRNDDIVEPRLSTITRTLIAAGKKLGVIDL